jgi:hypothetical protein
MRRRASTELSEAGRGEDCSCACALQTYDHITARAVSQALTYAGSEEALMDVRKHGGLGRATSTAGTSSLVWL